MKKQKLQGAIADINVTPMVDVMLVMLIIFMVVTPMLSKGKDVDLVKTKNPIAMADADKEDAVLVSITSDGKVYLGSDQQSPEALAGKVKDLLANRLSKICFVKSDSRARYSAVVAVVENLRSAGVDEIGLLTESEKQGEEMPAEAK
jgi:biopolymer transport protein ExbD/biopolymer transport protein TolR